MSRNREQTVSLLAALSLALFSVVFFLNAWVVDDAYITFRTIDNFLNGYGLRWNVAERVQTYTHPLWLLLLTPIIAVTREYFFTSLAVSYLLCITVWLYVWRLAASRRELWRLPALVACLIAVKAFVDYTSSGLENPLSYLLASVFFGPLLFPKHAAPDRSDLARSFFVASLAAVNRPDAILLFIPALLYLLVTHVRRDGVGILPALVLATAPLWTWLAFSVFYYGFPFPNTYYAKSAGLGISLAERAGVGLSNLTVSVLADRFAAVLAALACVLAVRRRRPIELLLLTGAALHVLYLVHTAGAATHMAHRFLAVPLFLAVFQLVLVQAGSRLAAGLAVAAVSYVAVVPNSPLRAGSDAYTATERSPSAIDAKWHAITEGASLRSNLPPGPVVPAHDWFASGRELHHQPHQVRIGGPAASRAAMGYFGFAAGPTVHIIDPVALCDPLLARLPVDLALPRYAGHFPRRVPEGYPWSLKTESNRLKDASLHAYYDALSQVTRGDLFDTERLVTVLEMNLGLHDHHLVKHAAQRRRSGETGAASGGGRPR